MPSPYVYEKVHARLGTWSSLAQCPLAETNMPAPSPQASFIEVEFPLSHNDQVSVGRPAIFREDGAFRLVLHVKLNAGLADAMTWVGELLTLFGSQVFDGIETFAADPPPFDDNNRRGAHYLLPIVVPYKYDVIA